MAERGEEKEWTSARMHSARAACLVLCSTTLVIALITTVTSAHALLSLSYATALAGSNVFVYGMAILLIVSALSLLISPPMLYSLRINDHWLLTLFSFSTLSIGSLGVLAFVLGIFLRFELAEGALEPWLAEGLQREYGHHQAPAVTHAWDRMQAEFHCCGVRSDAEWVGSDWFLGQVKYPRLRRPKSCCADCSEQRESACATTRSDVRTAWEQRRCEQLTTLCPSSRGQNLVCSGNVLASPEIAMGIFVHQEGCFPILERRLHLYSGALIVGGLLLAALLIAQTVAVFVLNYSTDALSNSAYDPVQTQIS